MGFVAFKAGDARASQRMMRARVLTQGATVGLMVATSGGAAMMGGGGVLPFGFGFGTDGGVPGSGLGSGVDR